MINWYLFFSGAIATVITIGHFTLGHKLYLKPMLGAQFDDSARHMMHAVFHYISIFFILSSLMLLAGSLGCPLMFCESFLVKFICLNYLLFAMVELVIALTSGVKTAPIKMFQWILFIAVALFAWLGNG